MKNIFAARTIRPLSSLPQNAATGTAVASCCKQDVPVPLKTGPFQP
jgi:hypothetical protein